MFSGLYYDKMTMEEGLHGYDNQGIERSAKSIICRRKVTQSERRKKWD
jgi:hypothetical protein